MPFKRIRFSESTTNVFRLMGGNVLGGIIYAVSIPFIAKLYSVEAFGLFQLLLSMATSLSSTSMFRFEKLIILAKRESDLHTALTLCIITLSGITFLFAGVMMLFGEFVFAFLNASQAADYFFLSVIALFMEGLILIVSEFTLRKKMFKEYSFYRGLSLSLFGLLPILFFLISDSFTVLFISRLAGYGICIVYLAYRTNFVASLKRVPWSEVKAMAIENYKFPVYNTPGTFLNNFSMNIPVFLLSRYFGEAAVGIYAMANRIVQMPLSVISSAMTNVYFRTAVEKAEVVGQLRLFFLGTVKKLAMTGLIPIVFLPFAPYLCNLFLGSEWQQTGVYLQILYPTLLMGFIASPVSGTFIIIRKQELVFLLALISICARYLSIYFFQDQTSETALLSYSLVSSGYYLLLILSLYYLINKREDGNEGELPSTK